MRPGEEEPESGDRGYDAVEPESRGTMETASVAGKDRPASSRETFEQLVVPVLDLAYRIAVQMARDPDEARDIVQEACLRAYRGFRGFDPGTNFKAWFLKIVTNLFLERQRNRKARREDVSLEDLPDLFLYEQTRAAGFHAASPDPAAALIEKIGAECLQEALESLPEDFRPACVLYFAEEMSYQEIAAILECPIGTVRSRLHRGRRILQRLLWDVAREHEITARRVAEGD